MALVDTALRGLKPQQKPKKYSDGGGLHLLVNPNGSKLWRLAYRFDGKDRALALAGDVTDLDALRGAIGKTVDHFGGVDAVFANAGTGLAGNVAEEMRAWGGRATVIAPGMVDTPFFEQPKPDKLKPGDVARAVLYALEQPRHANVQEIFVMPTG